MAKEKAGPVITDNGNFIVDLQVKDIPNPLELNQELIRIVGVVETGLFCGMADGVYFGMEDGSVKKVFKKLDG
jgi:ribose 5-phosphate isomerase A